MSTNNSSSSYAHLGDPYVLLEFSNSNCCRMAPYLKCTHCFSKCDSCCKGILQGAAPHFKYDLAGQSCSCNGQKIPNAIESCAHSGGLKCKYY